MHTVPRAVLGSLLAAATLFLHHERAAAPSLRVGDDPAIAAIQDYLVRAEAAGFSGVVSIAHGDRLLLSHAYGSRTCDGGKLDTHTPFYVASLSKGFTAAAVLKLESQGRLLTSDPITRFLPDVPPDKRGISIHHLLTHTSGIAEVSGDTSGKDRDAFVRVALANPLRNPIGASPRYSNTGYTLLAAIVERVSGQPFGAWLREELFRPAGLEDTGLITDARWASDAVAHACNGGIPQGDALLSHHRPHRFEEIGAVGVVTSAPDMARWVSALRAGAVVPDSAVAKIFTAHADRYGYGWVITQRDTGEPLHWHDGLLLPEGWNSQVRVYPEQDLTLVVLSNRHDEDPTGWIVARALDRLLFGGRIEMPPPVRPVAADWSAMEGEYALPGGGSFRLHQRGGRLELIPLGQPAVDAVLGTSPEQAAGRAAANERSTALLDALLAGKTPAADDPRGAVERANTTLRHLQGQWGALVGYEVLHSVPAPFGDESVLTFARLKFQRAAPTVRLIWDGTAFQGMSNAGAFVGASPTVPAIPAPLTLNPQGPQAFSAFRFSTGVRLGVRLVQDRDDPDCMFLRITLSNRTSEARRC